MEFRNFIWLVYLSLQNVRSLMRFEGDNTPLLRSIQHDSERWTQSRTSIFPELCISLFWEVLERYVSTVTRVCQTPA